MERYIAIDNVCAWPCLSQAPDSTLRATIYNQPTHGGCEGDTECWTSDDEGRSWQKLATVHPHSPGTNSGLNHAAGFTPDGTFIVLTMGRDNRPPVGCVRPASESNILPPVVCRSRDGGRTWVYDGEIELPRNFQQAPVPFGPLVSLEDNVLAATIHCDGSSYLYRSADNGKTWGQRSLIGAKSYGGYGYNETCMAVIGPGKILAALRTYGDQHLEIYFSDDNGTSWVSRGPITSAGQIPGNLLKLRNGRTLLTYGIRNIGLRGIGCRWSEDDGNTWSRPALLLNFEMITDGGYPSSVELSDGTIVTVYYAGATPAHMRYHMGVLRWRLEDLAEPHAFTQSYAGGRVWKNRWPGTIQQD